MDSPKPPHRPAHLLDDLESIREFLVGNGSSEPPLLTESVDPALIPLLSDVVKPGHERPGLDSPGHERPGLANPPRASTPPTSPTPPAMPRPAPPAASVAPSVQRPLGSASEQARLQTELRAAAQLILQDVIDDFVPQIEAELRRRLDARLDRLIAQRKS